MTDARPLIDIDDPDKLVRVGDVLSVLETDRDLARAVAEHHNLVNRATPMDKVELARYVCNILVEGVVEQERRLQVADTAISYTAVTNDLLRKDQPIETTLREKLRFLSLKPSTVVDVEGSRVG